MKKLIILLLAIILVTPVSIFAYTESADITQLTDNGVVLSVDGNIIANSGIVSYNNILFVPAETLLYSLSAVAKPDAAFLQEYNIEPVVFVLAHQMFAFIPGSKIVYVNEKIVTIEAAPFTYGNYLYVPLIEVARLTGQAVEHTTENGLQIISISAYNSFGEEAALFINALNANNIIRNGRDIRIPAGRPRCRLTAEEDRAYLKSSWNIFNRETALQVIHDLYAWGHNVSYLQEHEEAGTISQWGYVGILAWDLARVAEIASHSFTAGYLTFDEFIGISLPAAMVLQNHFTSREQMSENFVHGAAYWLRGSANEAEGIRQRQDAHNTFVENYLAILPPWNMDFELDKLDYMPHIAVENIFIPAPPYTAQRALRFEINSTTYTNNGFPNTLDAAPFIAYDRTMVPLRNIIEALGATSLNFDKGVITFNIGGETITMVIGEELPDEMGTPVIVADRTFVPLAYIVNEMGATARWDSEARAAYVYIE